MMENQLEIEDISKKIIEDGIVHDHTVAQIPAATQEDKILINAFLQAEGYRVGSDLGMGSNIVQHADLMPTLNGHGSLGNCFPHMGLSHPNQLAMVRENTLAQEIAIDTAIVDGVIRALEGDTDIVQPPIKKLKGPPPSAPHREWSEWYNDLLEFGAEHGHYNAPSTYVTAGGKRLGWWLTNQRRWKKQNILRAEKLELLQKLVDLGQLRWANEKPLGETGTVGWESWYADLLRYSDNFGHANVPVGYITANGRKLGQWLNNQKRAHRQGTLHPDRDAAIQKLVNSGFFVW